LESRLPQIFPAPRLPAAIFWFTGYNVKGMGL